jgi:hypothetical protein
MQVAAMGKMRWRSSGPIRKRSECPSRSDCIEAIRIVLTASLDPSVREG